VADTAASIRTFLVRHDPFRSTIAAVENMVGTPRVSFSTQPDRLWQTRLTLQQQLLDEDRYISSLPPGIIADIDGTLALRYFAIDCTLIAAARP
jgi:hypothetical protein